MTQKTWSDVDISSYMDGELDPEPQAALEADIARDPTLRRRVEEMQQVAAMVRAMPMREPPRNYLLTPSMIAEPKPEPQHARRRMPLGLMRLASSLVAIAFVISFGLTVLQRGMMPATVADRGPEAAPLRQQEEIQLAEAPQAPPEEPAADTAIEMDTVVEESEELDPQAEMAIQPMPEGAQADGEGPRGQGGGADGIGGGEPEESPMAMMATEGTPAPEGTPEMLGKEIETAAAEEIAEERAPTEAEAPEISEDDGAMASDTTGETSEAMPTDESAADGTGGLAYETTENEIRQQQPRLSPWISVGLGVATAIMIALTFWMSKRRS